MKLPPVVAALLAIAIYSMLFVVGRMGTATGLDGYDQTAIRFGSSSTVLLPFIFWKSKEAFNRLGMKRSVIVTLFTGAPYIGVGLCASFLCAYAIQQLGSVKVSAFSPLMPVMATLFALLLLNEVPSSQMWVGLAIVSGG